MRENKLNKNNYEKRIYTLLLTLWSNKPNNHWLSKQIKCIEDNLVFNSQTEAAKYYNTSVTTINNIINGRSKKTRNGKSFCSLRDCIKFKRIRV